MSSPFFKDLLCLPQPPDAELVDDLPVISLPEGTGLLNTLISLLYSIPSVIPGSYEEVFAILATCQKYDMVSAQSHIREEMKRGTFPGPVGAETFSAYVTARRMGLILEMENAARLTLASPMTFEFVGEGLRTFNGRALGDLIRYRKRCRDSLVSCLDSFFQVSSRVQLWENCQNVSSVTGGTAPTSWLRELFSSMRIKMQKATHAIFSPSDTLEEYLAALMDHTSSSYRCRDCIRMQLTEGVFKVLENELIQAADKVNTAFLSSTDLPIDCSYDLQMLW